MRMLVASKYQQSSQISKRALKLLKARLPKGFAKFALEDLNGRFHISSIYRVVKGEINNQEILSVLIDLAQKEDLRILRLEKEIKGIISVRPEEGEMLPMAKKVIPVISGGSEIYCIGYKIGNINPVLLHWRGSRIEFETPEEAEDYLKEE